MPTMEDKVTYVRMHLNLGQSLMSDEEVIAYIDAYGISGAIDAIEATIQGVRDASNENFK
jgi:hypothetical protein